MKRILSATLLSLLFNLCLVSCGGKDGDAAENKELTPAPVLAFQAYINALKEGDIEKADSLVITTPNYPKRYITDYNTVYSREYDKHYAIVVHEDETFISGNCAGLVASFGPENKRYSMRVVLVKQEGEWKTILTGWSRDLSWFEWDEELKKDRDAVEAWADKIFAEKGRDPLPKAK